MLLVLGELFLRPFAPQWMRFGTASARSEVVHNQALHSRLGYYWTDRHTAQWAAEEAERFNRPVFCPVEYAPFLRACREMKLPRPYDGHMHLWEADHILPVVEGGGECGIDNYRTLCIACHRAETAKLAARRAEKRRAEKGSKSPEQ